MSHSYNRSSSGHYSYGYGVSYASDDIPSALVCFLILIPTFFSFCCTLFGVLGIKENEMIVEELSNERLLMIGGGMLLFSGVISLLDGLFHREARLRNVIPGVIGLILGGAFIAFGIFGAPSWMLTLAEILAAIHRIAAGFIVMTY